MTWKKDSIDLFLGNYKVTSDDVKLLEQSKQEINRKYLAVITTNKIKITITN